MKSKSMSYGKGNKGGMKGPMKSSKADAKALKKGVVAVQGLPMDASDDESAEKMVAAPTKGLPKSSASAPMMHNIPENLLKHQSHLHEASGFVAKK